MAFHNNKQALIGPQIVAFSMDDGQYVLEADVSNDTVGIVLSHVLNGVEMVNAYGSRTLSQSGKNYLATD